MDTLNQNELKSMLRVCDVPTSGAKAVLRQKLEEVLMAEGKTLLEVAEHVLSTERMQALSAAHEMDVGEKGSPSGELGSPSGELGSPSGELGSPAGSRDGGRVEGGNIVVEVSPEDSVSNVSSRSSRSDVSRAERRKILRAQLVAAKVADLRASELEAMQRKIRDLETEKLQFERKAKAEVMEVELKALDDGERQQRGGEDNLGAPVGGPFIAPSTASSIGVEGRLRGASGAVSFDVEDLKRGCNESMLKHCNDRNLLSAFVECTLKAQLPKQVIEKFEGDVSKFRLFRQAFASHIESRLPNDNEKLHYLYQHTTGKPRRLVEACLNMNPEEGYKFAWDMLRKKYGNVEKIGTEYVRRLLARDVVRRDDAGGLEDFHMDLLMTKHAVSGISFGRAELENPKTLRMLVEKLPFALQDKWRYRCVKIAEKDGRNSNFEDLEKLVEEASKAANHPLYGRYEAGTYKQKGSIYSAEKRGVTCAVVTEIECQKCEGSHVLKECRQFLNMERDHKYNFLKQLRACFICLEPGHMAGACPHPERCGKCQGWHHQLLHEDRSQRKEDGVGRKLRAGAPEFQPGRSTERHVTATSVMATSGVKAGGMAALPVKVSCGLGGSWSTGAFLDTGSAVSFCTMRLARELNLVNNMDKVSLCISTMSGQRNLDCGLLTGLSVCGLSEECEVALPPIYVVESLPITKEDLVERTVIEQCDNLADLELPEVQEIDLMLGSNAAAATQPLELRTAASPGGPFALRTRIGWVVYGGDRQREKSVSVGRVAVKEYELNRLVERAFDVGSEDLGDGEIGQSMEDREWFEIVETGCRMVDGHYQIPLPLRKREGRMPDSRKMALNRALGLRKKLLKNFEYRERYIAFMRKMRDGGYFEEAEESYRGAWYVPHFGVEHPSKPGKVRVVFDCAAKVGGVSLNDLLLSGPDLNRKLVEVLLKFREGTWAYTADIDSMFYQVIVPVECRDYLRFFWWEGDDLRGQLREYRMKVHIFGACSSPSVAAYALRRTAVDNLAFDRDARDTVISNFYVDDCLKAVRQEEQLKWSYGKVKELCMKGGFNLAKFISNNSILNEEIVGMQDCRTTKALGVVWNLFKDVLKVDYDYGGRLPSSRRQLLAIVASMYDPLGIVAPLCLRGRLLVQQSFRRREAWDDLLNNDMQEAVGTWIQSLNSIDAQEVHRNLYKTVSGSRIELHIFSDASEKGHGAAAYISSCSDKGRTCSFVWGKARVNPLKYVSIPRLELMAAVLAARMKQRLARVLVQPIDAVYMWTDSLTVLRYLRNTKDRFESFVANRLSQIHSRTQTEEWKYVDSASNPADDASRGVQSSRWLGGPRFLVSGIWPVEPECNQTIALETKVTVMQVANMIDIGMDRLLKHFSSWMKLKRVLAYFSRFKRWLKVKSGGDHKCDGPLTLKEVEVAGSSAIKYIQRKVYAEEVEALISGKPVRGDSKIRSLDVFIDDEEILRVGGRFHYLYPRSAAPAILPRKSNITEMIVNEEHVRLGHLGSVTVLGNLRERFWIVKGHAAVRSILRKCITCRKVQGKVVEQKMAPLPEDRVTPGEPAFSSTGMDVFGPFIVKRRRHTEKKYGLLFCCLASRAIHLEVLDDMTTDSTINGLRRFKARRGLVKRIRCDRGTNFVGAMRELSKAWNEVEISKRLSNAGIDWQFNPPKASNFGGIWERMIRTVRRVLESVIGTTSLQEDNLRTLFCEVEAIVNSRPLNVVSSDCRDFDVITPNKLLNLAESVEQCGNFVATDSYSRRRWRQIQHLAECFWRKWRKLHRNWLMERQKWIKEKRNVQVGDVVLLVDEGEARCHWPMARVAEVEEGVDGLVRKAKIRVGDGKIYYRPVSKMILLLEKEDLY